MATFRVGNVVEEETDVAETDGEGGGSSEELLGPTRSNLGISPRRTHWLAGIVIVLGVQVSLT